MKKERLIYLPLGGSGEIGMNLYVYGFGPPNSERLIIVDAGVAFPNMESTPGIDLVLPDISWLKDKADRVDGIFLSHAHEDHLGAIVHLLRYVNAPVFARRFTSTIARMKLAEAQMSEELICEASVSPNSLKAGPFDVRFVPVSHSIPESSALAIKSPAGLVVHTGDFKTDKDSSNGGLTETSEWYKLSDNEITALVCDSTNVFVRQSGRSEASIGPALNELIRDAKGMVAATTFASNVHRVWCIANAGCNAGRSVVLLGRALNRMVNAAVESGVTPKFPPFLAPEVALELPREKLLLLTTGSQGEPRSATSQLSSGKFRGFKLVRGDTVLISSKTIPGNELSVARVVNRFSASGVKVIEDHYGDYHVSGHANRPDVLDLQRRLNPKLVVPMHGELRHLVAHAELAEANGFRSTVVANGQMLDLNSGFVVEEDCESGREYLDGSVIISAKAGIIRDRLRLSREGSVAVAVAFGRRHEFEIAVRCVGLKSLRGDSLEYAVARSIEAMLLRSDMRYERDEEILEREIRRLARKAVFSEIGKKPMVSTLITGIGNQ